MHTAKDAEKIFFFFSCFSVSLKTQYTSLSGGPAAMLLAAPPENNPSENSQVSCLGIYMFWGPGFSLQSPFGMWLQAFGSSTQREDRTSAVFTWSKNLAEGEQTDSGHSLESKELVPGSLSLEGHGVSSSSGSNWSDAFPPLAKQILPLWKMHGNCIQKMHLVANTNRISHEWNRVNLQFLMNLPKFWVNAEESPVLPHNYPSPTDFWFQKYTPGHGCQEPS